MKKILFHFALLFLFACNQANELATPPEPLYPVPNEAQLQWHEMELIAFIHFTTNTFTGVEWGYGDESPEIFNPTEMDVDQWIRILKDAGFKGVIITAKHHDGFTLWPSKYTEHSVKNSPYKNGNGDILRELSDSARLHGLKFGVYLSPWDRNHPEYARPEYITYYRNQLREIFENYGPIFEMWFDGANGGDGYYGGARETRTIDRETYYDWPATIEMVRELQPDPHVLFFSDAGPDIRWAGNEQGWVSETNWNTINNDTLYAGKAGIEQLLSTGEEHGTKWIPAEVDVSIRPGWFYHAEQDSQVKSPERLFDIYLSSVGRGSTLLLNIPPDRRGLIHEIDAEHLKEWRKIRDETFRVNLASGASVTADSYRGPSNQFHPNNVTDGNKDTYWATDDDVLTGSLEIYLDQEKEIHYVQLQEFIRLGQRVREFSIDTWNDGEWKLAANATTIGYKRIIPLHGEKTDRIRINISGSKASPLISSIEVY
jgi:alpha-L-fucosidase